ncbi:MAG: exodeoxyribonuclease VII small subunit [Candidatus Doudnabacteria bacterium]|nr:exodeoxyribonuclease VII small subunit [Candidatus Doudnabacteria bacterium]
MSKQQSINEQLGQLEAIVKWFESQKEVDVEKGLEKMKEGAVLIKALKSRLKEVENEFEEIKKDLDDEE